MGAAIKMRVIQAGGFSWLRRYAHAILHQTEKSNRQATQAILRSTKPTLCKESETLTAKRVNYDVYSLTAGETEM